MIATTLPFASSSVELAETRPSRSTAPRFSTTVLDVARTLLEPNGSEI
ncbi:hypothetical protein [Sphingomonas colocasiae]|uniref:Uncharacterized protein n=1 Tax=Sphingomonas colocasiae TaxID=1848973 RepID=A0ABS7PP55_9SPHN|nr:hypothetical protein [Sphingomonas colocasiae]MBY8823106.1 hypothetical protein [Sphingomonas colocasiae]